MFSRSIALSFLLIGTAAGAQSVQYTSPDGTKYLAQSDTGPVARAQAALAEDPKNIQKIIALGVAQSGARQFREAITTFDRGLALEPNNAMLLRWRGHRYLSTRQFDKAYADLTRGNTLDTNNYGIWYHLGIVRYVKGDFAGAAEAFRHAAPKAPDGGERAGSTDWRWMALMRAGKTKEAQAWLDSRPDTLKVDPNYAYAKRLRLYRGDITPEELIGPADTADVQVATLSYGLGNYYLVKGDTAKAREMFQRAIASGGWPGFGFILSEVDLKRVRGMPVRK